MVFKPVGVDDNNLFPVRVETRLATVSTADRARANHSGTQLHSTISDWVEAVQDEVGAMVRAGTNMTVTYDDTAGTLTFSSTGGGTGTLDTEAAQDLVAAMIVAGGVLTATYNDAAGTLTLASTATVNSSDAYLLARGNQTGTQVASTISDFASAALAATDSKMDDTEAVSLAQTTPGGVVVIDYYKAFYGAANAWPTTRPSANTSTVFAWLGPTDPGAIMVAGDLFWLDA